MADTNIKTVTMNYIASRISSAENLSQTKVSSSDSFSKQLDKTSKQVVKTEEKQTDTAKGSGLDDEIKKNQNVSRKQKDLEEQAAGDSGAAAVDNSAAATVVTEETPEDAATEVIAEFKESVAEQLDMSVEELEGIMDSMDFSDMDLFDTEKLGMIVLEANGLSQTQDLLFDKTASDEFKSVMSLLESANNELDQLGVQISEDGFLNNATGEIIQTDNVKPDQGTAAADDMSAEADKNMSEAALTVRADVKDAGITESSAEKSDTNITQDTELSAGNVQNTADTQENQGTSQENSSESKNQRQENLRTDNAVINNTNVGFNPIEEIQAELSERVGGSQAENIVSQLLEQIKINVNGEFKSMELQLYPENLGKVGIQVAVKDGVVTAHITTENETVKRAVEAQLINLKESFNNQGLKVENVEVAIASHSFEENNMHNHGEQSNQSRSKRARRLNAALVDELNGKTDEQSEEAIMETLGNTVSYSA